MRPLAVSRAVPLGAGFFCPQVGLFPRAWGDRLDPMMACLVVEIHETPTEGPGCSVRDRRILGRRTIPRLQEEFGALIEVRWTEPARTACTLPAIVIAGQTVHEGGYLPWETLRPMVAHALALESGVCAFGEDAVRELRAEGVVCEDWQDGLLRWLEREQGLGGEDT